MVSLEETQQRRIDRLEEALQRIVEWSEAYPLKRFPKPNEDYLACANEVLAAASLSLDRISADTMRHVTEGVGKIARDALSKEPPC